MGSCDAWIDFVVSSYYGELPDGLRILHAQWTGAVATNCEDLPPALLEDISRTAGAAKLCGSYWIVCNLAVGLLQVFEFSRVVREDPVAWLAK